MEDKIKKLLKEHTHLADDVIVRELIVLIKEEKERAIEEFCKRFVKEVSGNE